MTEFERIKDGKKAKIEILKDNKRLIYTATIISLTDRLITFKDRYGEVFTFPVDSIKQIQYLNNGDSR